MGIRRKITSNTRALSKPKMVEGLTKDEAMQAYIPKVRIMAQSVARQRSALPLLDDLFSAGLIGLMDAFERFEPGNGALFKTYAEIRIRGSMLDELRRQSWVPRSIYTHAKEIERVHSKFQNSYGRRASDKEIANSLGVSETEARSLQEAAQPAKVLNIDDYRSFNEADRRILMQQSDELGPFASVQKNKLRDQLMEVTKHLPERQRQIILLMYFEGLSGVEIATRLGITSARVSQLHSDAMAFLRRDKDMRIILMSLYKELAA